ncbi:hypothetical protein TeGR_g3316, partial [Tetraparma gracilis]
FVMAIDTLQSSPTFQLSKVYKVDLGGPTPGTLGTPVEIGNHETSAFDFKGIEADEDNNYFLTHRYSDRFGVPDENCMSSYDSTGAARTALNSVLCNFVPGAPIDALGIRMAPNGLLYVSDFSFDLPIVVDPNSGDVLGRLGTGFGMLAFSHKFAFKPGAFGPRCDVRLVSSSVESGGTLAVSVDLYDMASQPWCDASAGDELVAVQGGALLFDGTPGFYDELGVYQGFTQDAAVATLDGPTVPCNRWSLTVPASSASLTYEDEDGVVVVDPRLRQWILDDGTAEQKAMTKEELHASGLYTFNIKVFNALNRDFDMVLGDGNGNDIHYGGRADDFTYKIDGEDYKATVDDGAALDESGMRVVDLTTVDNLDGTYDVCVMFGPAGIHFVSVLFDDNEVASSPLSTVVKAGEPVGSNSVVSGDGIEYMLSTNTEFNVFYVQPKDYRNNVIEVSALTSDMIEVQVVGGSVGDVVTIETEVVLESDGRWKVSYKVLSELGEDDYYRVRVSVKVQGLYAKFVSGEGEETSVKNYLVQQSSRIIEFKISMTLKVLMLLECAFLLLATLACAGLIRYWQGENAIKFSQRRFLNIILVGMFLLYLAFLLLLVGGGDIVCQIENFCFHLGVWTVMLALAAKTYRTNRIANNKGLKRVKITDVWLLQKMGLIMCGVIVALIVQWAVWPAAMQTRMGNSREQKNTGVLVQYIVEECTAGTTPVSIAMFGAELMCLIYLAVLAHFTRKVPSAFAEAKYIAIAIYNILLILVFFAVLVGGVSINTDYPELYVAMAGFAMFMGVFGGMLLIFVPKFYLVVRKKEVKLEDMLNTGGRNSTKALKVRDEGKGEGGDRSEHQRMRSKLARSGGRSTVAISS